MRTPGTPAQSQAARRAGTAELARLIAKFSPDQARLVTAVRRWLKQRVPAAHEIVYAYRDCFVVSVSPTERGYEGVLSIRGSADGVRLYINRAKGFPDPARLLRGTAQVRWIELEGASTLKRPEVAALVDVALQRNRIPFATTGRGTIVTRSTTVTPRSKRVSA